MPHGPSGASDHLILLFLWYSLYVYMHVCVYYVFVKENERGIWMIPEHNLEHFVWIFFTLSFHTYVS